jgi:alpha-glucosidase
MRNPLDWTAGVHHDGSSLYVSNPLPTSGETVTLWVRTPVNSPVQRMFLRTAPEGEPNWGELTIDHQDSISAWWCVDVRVNVPLLNYRFKILTPGEAYYLTQYGVNRNDSPDWFDFRLLADFAAPNWLPDTVFYQIFPDRFFNADSSLTPPEGAWSRDGFTVQRREWGLAPLPYKEAGNLDFYGGDLPGITEKLDYLTDLGVNALYLNPIFVSASNHRYDIRDFYTVDPHLGGNEALVALRRALDERNMRLILDITLNHTGSDHPWFVSAQNELGAPTSEYYTFYERPHRYETWLGVNTLPKLNYRSEALRNTIYREPDSAIRRWLREPYCIDGWRLDVYNTMARQGMNQMLHKVSRQVRRAVKSDNPQAYLFGEHFFDATPHLQGDELDAVMNYAGFNIPTWRWLIGYESSSETRPEIADRTLYSSEAYSEHLSRYRTAVPWVITRQQFNQLCSHDTTRILRILGGDKNLLRLAVALLMTYPGVPCIYYGDEIGMDGGRDPDNRRTMPWNEAEWDNDLRAYYKRLIQFRRTSPALMHGGFQMLYAADGLIVFQRESHEQQIIFIGFRGPDPLDHVEIPVWHGGIADGKTFTDFLSGNVFSVQNGALQLRDVARGWAAILVAE